MTHDHAPTLEHDDCGCGHAHGEPNAASAPTQLVQAEGGCGDGCGCGHAQGGLQLHPMEGAALRGFLSGLHAARLEHAELAEYLEALGQDADSEFARPAQFLASTLDELAAADALGDEPAAALLDAVTGGADGDDEE